MSEYKFDQKTIAVPAELSQLKQLSDFIGEFLDHVPCPGKSMVHIRIAVDEIFSNIARHSETGDTVSVTVRTDTDPRAVVITFADGTDRFDPLAAAAPDVTVPAGKRKIGGLGLFMLKKLMDEVSYEYRDSQNVLTIRKYL